MHDDVAQPLFLAVDVGNSRTALGVLRGGDVMRFASVRTDPSAGADSYLQALRAELDAAGAGTGVEGAGFCCVVPAMHGALQDALLRAAGASPLCVGPEMETGIRVLLDSPGEVGGDRLANAAGGRAAYPDKPVLVVDFGTATTFDAISAAGEYLGGAIVPGIGMAAEALHRGTARLPLVEPAPPRDVIGRNTVEAMQSGIYYGYTCLVDGMTARIKERLGEDTVVLATGGYAATVCGGVDCIDAVDPHLTLKGIKSIWDLNR